VMPIRKARQFLVSIFLLLSFAPACSRYRTLRDLTGDTSSSPPSAEDPLPGGLWKNCSSGVFPAQIQLLPGYQVETCGGMEHLYGRIRKQSGFTIEFFESWVSATDSPVLWNVDQVIDGDHAMCLYRADHTMEIRFRGADFFAKPRDEQDTAEMFLTVLSYRVPEPVLIPGLGSRGKNKQQ
jgi:hypothetical protein